MGHAGPSYCGETSPLSQPGTEQQASSSPDPGTPPETIETTAGASDAPDNSGGAALGDTAGTGTIIALGCITGTIFLIILGLVYLLITQVF